MRHTKRGQIVSKVVALLLALTLTPAYAQDVEPDWDNLEVLTGIEVPNEHIPVYYCVLSFFEGHAKLHIERNILNQLMESVGVSPSLTQLKDRISQLTVFISGLADDDPDYTQAEYSPGTWQDLQDTELEKEVGQVKALYDAFLEECDRAGLDAATVHQNIVAEGRASTAIGTSEGPPFSRRVRAALRVFEENNGAGNPWLSEPPVE